MYNAFLRPWAGRRLLSIRKSDVQALHARIGQEHGPYAANRMLGMLAAMFNAAVDMGYRGDNPAKGVQRFKETSRRFLARRRTAGIFSDLCWRDPMRC